MTPVLPVVDILAGMHTDKDRAWWLLQVPDAVILRDFGALRALLEAAGFSLGVEFLNMRHAALHAVRMPDGGFPPEIGGALGEAWGGVLALSRGVLPAGEGSVG